MPQATFYKPQGVPLRMLESVALAVDELEAIRLADLEGLYQEEAAQRMNVSRQTFGRILDAAHKKVADALVNGKALSIAGGSVEVDEAAAERPCPGQAVGQGHGRHGRRRGGPLGGCGQRRRRGRD